MKRKKWIISSYFSLYFIYIVHLDIVEGRDTLTYVLVAYEFHFSLSSYNMDENKIETDEIKFLHLHYFLLNKLILFMFFSLFFIPSKFKIGDPRINSRYNVTSSSILKQDPFGTTWLQQYNMICIQVTLATCSASYRSQY